VDFSEKHFAAGGFLLGEIEGKKWGKETGKVGRKGEKNRREKRMK